MSISITSTSGGTSHGNPFVGPVGHTATVPLDVSDMSDKEVDTNGYLKPGLPLKQDGNMIGSGNFVFGVVVEAVKVASGNTDVILDAVTPDPYITVCTVGQVQQDIIEDNLGRALTADELAGFDIAGCKITLIRT